MNNIKSVQNLRNAYPELVKQIEQEAEASAVDRLVNNAKYHNPMTMDEFVKDLEEKQVFNKAIDNVNRMRTGNHGRNSR